jgi:hypothetical protein
VLDKKPLTEKFGKGSFLIALMTVLALPNLIVGGD